jgi:hypothetical protein
MSLRCGWAQGPRVQRKCLLNPGETCHSIYLQEGALDERNCKGPPYCHLQLSNGLRGRGLGVGQANCTSSVPLSPIISLTCDRLGHLWIRARLRDTSDTRSDGSAHSSHRLHPRDALRRVLGLHR